MYQADLGAVRFYIFFNFSVNGRANERWNTWHQSPYCQSGNLRPLVFDFGSFFLDIPGASSGITQVSSDLRSSLEAHSGVIFECGWQTNPFLSIPPILHLLEYSRSHPNNRKILISSDYLFFFDLTQKFVFEFFRDRDRKEVLQASPLASLITPLIYLLPEIDSYFVHSSGILFRDHEAIIFLAPSGGGKTTVTRLAHKHGLRVLGDDRILISKRDEGFLATSVPQNRVTDGPDWGSVSACVVLRKGHAFSVAPTTPTKVLSKVWADNPGEWYSFPPEYRKKRLTFYSDLFWSVPVYEMTFEKDYVDWDALADAMFPQ